MQLKYLSTISFKLKCFLLSIRYKDSAIFQSPAIVGLAIFFPLLSWKNIYQALLLIMGSFLLMAYIFAINDWADIDWDTQNSEKQGVTFTANGVSSKEILGVSIILALTGLLFLSLLSNTHFLIGIMLILFGLMYSIPLPKIKGKNIPIISTLLHFATALLVFLLGSITYSVINDRALLVGSYLGLIISAGHMVQEVQDYEGDRLSGDWTNAVRFGPRPVFISSFLLFSLSFVFLFWLTRIGFLPTPIRFTLLLYPVYIFESINAYRAGLSRNIIKNFRKRYRLLFALIMAIIVASVSLERFF